MGRIPEWGRWLLSGSFSGTVVSALLTPTLFLVYSYQFAWDLLIWIVAPAGICAGAAYAIGAWMWGSSRPSPVT